MRSEYEANQALTEEAQKKQAAWMHKSRQAAKRRAAKRASRVGEVPAVLVALMVLGTLLGVLANVMH